MSVDHLADITVRLFGAAGVTVFLAFTCALCGLAIAVPMALARMSSSGLLRLLASSYVFVFRGTPGLVQLFFLYYGVAQLEIVRESIFWPILRSPWWCAIIALSLNTGAYTTEIVRGALVAVPREQLESARALGMSPRVEFWMLRVPLAIRIGLPAYGNEIVLLIKATTIVSTITLLDLMGEARLIYAQTFDPIAPMLIAAAIYVALGVGVAWMVMGAERIAFRERRRAGVKAVDARLKVHETGH